MPDADNPTMRDVCNYLYWAQWSDLDIKFELTEEDYNYIGVSYNENKYKRRFARDEQW